MPIENLTDEEKRVIEVRREAERQVRQDARCEAGNHMAAKDGKCPNCDAAIVPPAPEKKKSKFEAIA